MTIRVLRLDHRPIRDKRVTTHVILTARALGASSAVYTGERDPFLEQTIENIVSDWGGSFTLKYSEKWEKAINDWEGKVVHLTMYGIPLQDIIQEIKSEQKLLVIVGGSKVPSEIYETSNWNVAVTSQPHSEVSALGIFLHEFLDGKELAQEYRGARLRIIPQKKGKKVEKRKTNV